MLLCGFQFRKWTHVVAALILLGAQPTYALNPSKAITQYVRTAWNTDSGLPQGSVYSIAQTADGYLWVGTDLGLARFDGTHFDVFNRASVPALPSNYIAHLLAASDGSLWIGTDSGLTRLHNGVWSTWTEQTGLSDNNITALAEEAGGALWIGTGNGLDRLRDGHLTTWHVADGLPGNGILSLAPASDGGVWVGTNHGLAHLSATGFHIYKLPAGFGEAVEALAIGPDGTVWAGSAQGKLARMVNGQLTLSPVRLPRDDIDTLLFDHDGNLWIGFASHGLARLHDGTVTFAGAPTLPGQTVDALFQDREHSLWVGLFDGGLVQLRDGRFFLYGKPEGLSSNNGWAAAAAPDGSLWVGTSTGQLNHRLADGTVRVYITRDGLSGEVIYSMLLARDGTLWIGNRHGVLTHERNGRFVSYRDPQARRASINALLEAPDGQLWIGSYGAGLARFDHGRFLHITTTGNVTSLARTPDGAVWAGTDGNGVLRLQNGATTRYTTAEGLLSNHVYALDADSDGTVWIGSTGGLNRILDGHISAYTQKDGLFDSTVGNIVEDDDGNLWMSSDSGIFQASKRDLDLFAGGEVQSIRSRGYGTADGLRSQDTMQGGTGSAFRDPGGRLWFCTMDGVAAFNPTRMRQPYPPLPMRIESVIAGGQPLALTGRLRIGPGQSRLKFHFSALSFISPAHIHYRYRLNGYDPDWVTAGVSHWASYTGLSPGSYTFEVEAARPNGPWTPRSASIRLTVLPPWYRSTLAWLGWIACAFLLTWGLIDLRMRSLIRRRRELEIQVRERTTQLENEKAALAAAHKRLEIQASHDSLTGIWNHASILEHLEREVVRATRQAGVLTVVLADLDHFKNVNDSYGHLCGDRVLRETGQRLQNCLRGYDVLGRYGGEEFLILMPGCDPALNPDRLDDLVSAIGSVAFSFDGQEIHVTCSLGATVLRPAGSAPSTEDLLRLADAALYRAKLAGRNRVEFAEPEISSPR